MLWLQRQDHSHPDTARIDRRTPDRLLIKERLAHYLKQANLRRDLGRIAVGAFTGPAGTFRQRNQITPRLDIRHPAIDLTNPQTLSHPPVSGISARGKSPAGRT